MESPSPRTPERWPPQQRTPPAVVTAQVFAIDVPTPRAPVRTLRPSGGDRSIAAPFPIWPESFRPQQRTLPVVSTTQVCPSAAEIFATWQLPEPPVPAVPEPAVPPLPPPAPARPVMTDPPPAPMWLTPFPLPPPHAAEIQTPIHAARNRERIITVSFSRARSPRVSRRRGATDFATVSGPLRRDWLVAVSPFFTQQPSTSVQKFPMNAWSAAVGVQLAS